MMLFEEYPQHKAKQKRTYLGLSIEKGWLKTEFFKMRNKSRLQLFLGL